jgi:hypothetical protein
MNEKRQSINFLSNHIFSLQFTLKQELIKYCTLRIQMTTEIAIGLDFSQIIPCKGNMIHVRRYFRVSLSNGSQHLDQRLHLCCVRFHLVFSFLSEIYFDFSPTIDPSLANTTGSFSACCIATTFIDRFISD